MIKQCTLSVWLFLLSIIPAFAQSSPCAPGEAVLRFELTPDFYWYEVSWQVTNTVTGQVLYSEECTNDDPLVREYCVPDSTCLEFKMLDDAGDGLYPTGFYKLYLNGNLVFENTSGIYGASETTSVGCPPGFDCNNSLPIVEGDHATLGEGVTTWFNFTPTANGMYQVSTCDTANLCPTKIWVYGVECSYIVPTPGLEGALFFSQGGCGNDSTLALANLFLEGGKTYYIRIGHASGDCNGDPILFNLSYVGPITGCTDPTACNYDPLASVSGDCIYPGDPACPNAPDLMVVESAIKNSFQVSSINNNDPCFIEEGCLKGTGQRYLIRFDTHIKNIGNAPYYIGQTPVSPTTPSSQFVYDPCHNHWHYLGYAEYVLYDANGNYVPVGSKTGFCVLDLECDDGGDETYTCQNMGISPGCGDIYDRYLDCQWIDITGLPAGQYTFVMRVNWDQSPDKLGRVEASYDNNWGQACFQLNYNANGSPDVDLLEPCAPYVDCAGVPYGTTERDCQGVCGGSALHGDVNANLERETDDVAIYMQDALVDMAEASLCRDLFLDGHTDVYDAALLQECVLHGDSVAYWGSRFACEFPTGKVQNNDLVYLRMGTVDTIAKTLDVMIHNPFNKLLGYEFELSGVRIDSVKNLAPEFEATILHTDKRILALSQNEKPMAKHGQPYAALRVYYTNVNNNYKVCLDSVMAVVNERYNKSAASIVADNACGNLFTSSVFDRPTVGAFPVSVVPNPAIATATVFFPNEAQLSTDVTLTDMQGRVVRNFNGIREGSVTFSREDLPQGIYIVHLRNASGLAMAKVIWQ